jgi:dihydroorotate dehydrogenase (fumarate)
MDLTTNYLGLRLRNPFIVGASPLIYNLDRVRQLEAAGAAAIVMHSLFEEQITQQDGRTADGLSGYQPQAAAFELNPESYLKQLIKIKKSVEIPVIASINGSHEGTWVEYARKMEDAGADAIELNLYFLPRSDDESAAVIEQRAFQIVRMIRQYIKIPISLKLSPFFTSLINFSHRMEEAGASGIVLFNRFFQPDIDIYKLENVPSLRLSSSQNLIIRLRWLTMLHGRLRLSLSCTGGVITYEDAVKAIMAGADTVQMVSAVMRHGPDYLSKTIEDFSSFMETNGHNSLSKMRGCMSFSHSAEPEQVARSQYMRIIQGWQA